MNAPKPGCMMCHSLYVAANGDVPCWDDVGEDHVLWQLDPTGSPAVQPMFHHPKLLHIRDSFNRGRLPFPGLCERCAVKGCGSVGEARPTAMQVLHLEASYRCHLSCPQCIPARERRHRRAAPHHMTVALLEQVLGALRAEGVSDLQFVHFEGRGDPLANPWLQDLIRAARRSFPQAWIGATTHGSYAAMDWIARSGLDLLRVSVDGAAADSYARYRIGGDFHKTQAFMQALTRARRQAGSQLHVEWKYILFEWNDSDDEIRAAYAMARDLEVRLHFCLTHTPGRSPRFGSVDALRAALDRLAPGASCDATFQLRSDADKRAEARAVAGQCAASTLAAALEAHARGDEALAVSHLQQALKADPGLDCICGHGRVAELVRSHLDEVLAGARSPATLTGLAAVCRACGEHASSSRLLRRYLEIAPQAPDRVHVLHDLRRPSTVLRSALDGIRKVWPTGPHDTP